MKDNTLLVIDGDLLAFKAAATNERRSVVLTHNVSGETREFSTRTQAKASLLDYSDWSIQDVQEPNPAPYAYSAANDLIDKWMARAEASEYQIVVSGKNNFRDSIPLPTKYKSNRVGSLRPLLLSDVKQWLLKRKPSVLTEGYEADDYLSMMAYTGYKQGRKIVQCTIDKDAYGCQGWLMHMDKDEPPELIEGFGSCWVTDKRELKGKGTIWHLIQGGLIGDSSDGYFPKELSGKKFGDVAAYSIIKDATNEREALVAIYEQMKKWYPEPVTYVAHDGNTYTKDAVDIWTMYMLCAKMLRWEGDFIDMRKVLKYYGIAQ